MSRTEAKKELEKNVRELIRVAAVRSSQDEVTFLEAQADSPDEIEAYTAVVLLRMRAGAYAIIWQAEMLKQLVDEGELAGAINCLEFISALTTGFETAARTVVAPLLPEYLP